MARVDDLSDDPGAVLIIGGRGEFGQFLQRDILPDLGASVVLTIERQTPRDQHFSLLRRARHVVLATPLSNYIERACELVDQCRDLRAPTTLWLISSVQAGVWRTVKAELAKVKNPYLAAVFAHPMYGPNGFRKDELEAQTFRNILTAGCEGAEHPVAEELAQIANAFRDTFNIETTDVFDPEEHDRITAYSQGLSYCVAEVMFERPEIDAFVQSRIEDLHRSFHANRNLIIDFLRVNAYIPEVASAFRDSWQQTNQSALEDLLHAFAQADTELNRGDDSPIPTKWYEKLRAASHRISGA